LQKNLFIATYYPNRLMRSGDSDDTFSYHYHQTLYVSMYVSM